MRRIWVGMMVMAGSREAVSWAVISLARAEVEVRVKRVEPEPVRWMGWWMRDWAWVLRASSQGAIL